MFGQKNNIHKTTDRFLLLCASRTGSTMLRLMLNSHTDITCYGEIYGPNQIRERFLKNDIFLCYIGPQRTGTLLVLIRNKFPIFFNNRYVVDWNAKASGFKMLYGHYNNPRFTKLTDRFADDKELKIIHLLRKNHLKRNISQAFKRLELYARNHGLPTVSKIQVDPKHCIEDIEKTKNEEAKFREIFSHHEYLEIFYEDIINRTKQEIFKVQRFLNVKPANLPVQTHKGLSDDLRDLIDNFEDLAKYFKNTKYEKYVFM